ncbi:MAG: transposase [Balneolaceae bacterium]|nr:transposase [Balneolaceae bacterium]
MKIVENQCNSVLHPGQTKPGHGTAGRGPARRRLEIRRHQRPAYGCGRTFRVAPLWRRPRLPVGPQPDQTRPTGRPTSSAAEPTPGGRSLPTSRRPPPKKIVAFYNGRGASERLFDVMGNDFGWSKLPCSLLSHNTAFMILTGIIANFYRYLIELIRPTTFLATAYFPAQEVYLPLHQRPRQVDSGPAGGLSQTLHRQGLQPPAGLAPPLGATNVWKRNIVYGRGVHTSR